MSRDSNTVDIHVGGCAAAATTIVEHNEIRRKPHGYIQRSVGSTSGIITPSPTSPSAPRTVVTVVERFAVAQPDNASAAPASSSKARVSVRKYAFTPPTSPIDNADSATRPSTTAICV